MSEPTIDEMLSWLKRFDYTAGGMPKAICAILEQHRLSARWHPQKAVREVQLDAIRAFVERVKQRVDEQWRNAAMVDQAMYTHAYVIAVDDELAAIEAEVKE